MLFVVGPDTDRYAATLTAEGRGPVVLNWYSQEYVEPSLIYDRREAALVAAATYAARNPTQAGGGVSYPEQAAGQLSLAMAGPCAS